jgi:hypothetical protein
MRDFFLSILPDTGVYFIATPSKNGGGFSHYPCETLDEVVAKSIELDTQKQQTYFACASFKQASYVNEEGKTRYRTAENVGWAKSFWLDIDCGEDKTTKGTGYRTQRDAFNALKVFIDNTYLPFPIIVSSGGGYHCYWPLETTVTKEQWLPIANKLKALTQCADILLLADDSRTADIASLLRPVGTHNWKPERGGKEVLLKQNSDSVPFEWFREVINVAHAKYFGFKPSQAIHPNPQILSGLTQYKSITLEQLIVMLSFLDPDMERINWWGVLAAVADEYGEDAREIMLNWSSRATEENKFNEADFHRQYSDALSRTDFPGKKKSMGSLVMMARDAGWTDPRKPSVHEPSSGIEKLNENFAWIEKNASIYRLDHSDFIDPAKFKTQHDNQTVSVQSGTSIKQVGVGSMWIKHPSRRQHRQLVLRPKEGLVTHDNCLNEWRGFALEPTPGDIAYFLKLLDRLVPDQAAKQYILLWMAHLLQHPEIKMNVSLAFWSLDQGVGKNLLFECISSIIGSTHSTVIGQAELAASFNGWANRKVLVIGDEVSSSDRRQDADKLKGLVTGTTIYINEKYQPAREVQNFVNFIFLSNHHDALFVDDRDRRFFVWEITAGRLPDAIANEFVKWRDNGGLSALLDYLLTYDISSFNPKAPAPMTDAKQQMAADNRSDLESWLADLFASGASVVLGRELATSHEIATRYSHNTGNKASAKAVTGTCKKLGALARINQVRLTNGKKVRVLAIDRPEHWKLQPEAVWATEMDKPCKL